MVAIALFCGRPNNRAVLEDHWQGEVVVPEGSGGCLKRPPRGHGVGDTVRSHQSQRVGGVAGYFRGFIQQGTVEVENDERHRLDSDDRFTDGIKRRSMFGHHQVRHERVSDFRRHFVPI